MSRPNILLITTDQQRYDTIGAAGYGFMHTPNLDSLASDGVLYRRAYSPVPACVPARHCIVTGLPPRDHGFDQNYFDNARQVPYDIASFPRLLSDVDYDTHAIGKMHFSPTRRSNGFDHLCLMEEIPRYLEDDDYAMFLRDNGWGQVQSVHGVRHLLYFRPQQSFVPEHLHGSSFVADRTIDAIRRNRGNRPFFIWSSFIHPHPPLDVPPRWAHLYDDVEIPSAYSSITPVSKQAEETAGPFEGGSAEILDRVRRLYYSAISFVDWNIGRIIDELKRLGMYDDTLIIFTSDHGEMLGDNGAFQKEIPYEPSIHVPFILKAAKGIAPTVEADEKIDLYDIMPTILDAAGAGNPDHAHVYPGASLFSTCRDREYIYTEFGNGSRRWIGLVGDRYKYNYYFAGGREELFDLHADKEERRNLLFGDPSDDVMRIRNELRAVLIRKEKEQGLPGYLDGDRLKVLDDFPVRQRRERNFPMFVKKLSPEERASFLPLDIEMELAIRNEPLMNMSDLDLSELPKEDC